MVATILNGKIIAQQYRHNLKQQVEQLKQQGVHPKLTVVIVGDNPASQSYVKAKHRACLENGFLSDIIQLEPTITEQALITQIHHLNEDPTVHGILIQLPLPQHIDEQLILNAVAPHKDVDGFNPVNVGKLVIGEPTFVPCTPLGIIQLIKETGTDINGKNALVIGRSNIVGKPVALLLLQENATVTIAHSRTKDLKQHLKDADIVVAAVGLKHLISGHDIKEGAIVIDVGNNFENGKMYGDVNFDEALERASFITPVPGGVGPMTITMLLNNTLLAAKMI